MDKEAVDKIIAYVEAGNAIAPAEVLKIVAYYKGCLARIKQVTQEMAPDPRQEVLPFARIN